MENHIEKFLEFNGKVIYFLAKDGQYWIAIKPICEALGVDYERQRKNLKSDKFWNELPSNQAVVASDNKVRKMLCLPEQFIYGWLCSIQSSNAELIKYKRVCYQLLYEHFHGKITSRETLIGKKTKLLLEHEKLVANFRTTPEGQRALEIEKSIRLFNASLKELDKEIELNQLPLFS